MKILILVWLLIAGSLAMAQTLRTDILHKLDGQTMNVKIDELTDTDIIYLESANAGTKKKMARSEVWKIVFGDGSTEIINPLPNATTTTPTDRITLLNQNVVDGKVIRRDATKLYYTKPEASNGAQYELLLARLDNVRYADGRVESFRKTGGGNSISTGQATVNQPVAISKKENKRRVTSNQGGISSAQYGANAFERLHVTVGPEFSYYPNPLNKDRAWLDDSTGFGMKQNIGGSLRVDYRFIKPLAVSITAGYFGWELLRRYTLNGIDEYTETKRLTQIPLQLGVKIYPFGGFYLLPEGGVNLLFASIKTSDGHPTPANESVTSTPITYGASLGYEIRASKLLFDLSLRYKILNVSNLSYREFQQNLNESVTVAGFRLGIGFRAIKK